jgi:hypothetical protein
VNEVNETNTKKMFSIIAAEGSDTTATMNEDK